MTASQPRKVSADQVVANRRRGGDIRVTLSPKTVGSTSGFGGVMWLAPDDWVSEHYHPYSEEFVHVIAGQVEITVDGTPCKLGPRDSLMVPINARHRMVNLGDEVAYLVFHLSPLAPRPELGHVDTEEARLPGETQPEVGRAR